jgi:prepilin-type N-terminal cleavage/methylation domain-containing protein
MRQGFSLVELSIVLGIVGLLVGGILAGRSLVRASELRAVGTEYQRYMTAVYGFRDKYFAIPGDFRDGTQFWGRMNANADCVSNSAAAVTSGGVCDGNGSGLAGVALGASQSGEWFQFWRHLSAAGLIEGSYSGLAGPLGAEQAVLGNNSPASRIAQLGWSLRGVINPSAGDGANFAFGNGNQLIYGKVYVGAGPVYGPTYGGGLRAEEAWNIDSKIDDGRPATGKAIVYNRHQCTNSTSATDVASIYLLNGTTTTCGFYFSSAF